MKRILLDYLRRKWWIFACGGLAVLGQALATRVGTELKFGGMLYQVSFFMAALPLSMELQQGVLRVTALLPLSARQLGRAWWWAGVGVPASITSALLTLGAFVQVCVHPERPGQWDALALTITSLWLWLGAAFTVLFQLGQAPSQDWRQRTRNIGLGIVWGLMIGGTFFFIRWIEDNTVLQIVLLVAGVLLTVASWTHAGQMVRARAGFRLSAAPGGTPDRSRSLLRLKGKRGGVGYLIGRSCLRSILFGFFVLSISPLMMVLMGGKDWRAVLQASVFAGSVPFWAVLVFAMVPVLMQLRLLRTLPLSSDKLALTLLAALLVPGLVLGAMNVLPAAFVSGPEAALLTAKKNLLALAALSLSAPLAVWRGLNGVGYALQVVLICALQAVPMIFSSVLGNSHPLGIGCALLIIPLAYFLTRYLLERSGKAYRANMAPFAAWGGAR